MFDGSDVTLNIKLGNMYYLNKGVNETYEATKIQLKYPSEHYITYDFRTPRFTLELQITHILKSTTNSTRTNKRLKVQKAVVSILFAVGDNEDGDNFFNAMGINQYNRGDLKSNHYSVPKAGEQLTMTKLHAATFPSGFNYVAFSSLINLLNADSHLYFYYGSDTVPPCQESNLWVVFANPRSISRSQADFLQQLIVKNIDPQTKNTENAYGNKRNIVVKTFKIKF